MSYSELNRGDRGEEVTLLQSYLNRVGAMLIADGDFGPATETGVRYVQDIAGMANTGSADESLWHWLETQEEPYPLLATNGIAFIALEETGGLRHYHNFTRWPHFPGYSSGITIGVGYDLRFNSEESFKTLWASHLPEEVVLELSSDIGKRGTKKRVAQLKRLGVEIPFKAAWPVFVDKTLPTFYTETESIYPSLPRLPDMCRSVLVSLVFNRGASLTGSRRSEMRAIRDILVLADNNEIDKRRRKMILVEVEDQLISMKRLWNPHSGVYKRRQAEANLWRTSLEAW